MEKSFPFFHVGIGFFHDVLRFVQHAHVGYHLLFRTFRTTEKGAVRPIGTHCGNGDFAWFQFHVQSPCVTVHKCFGCCVNILKRCGLKGGNTAELRYFCPLVHERKQIFRERYKTFAVEPDHVCAFGNGNFVVSAKFAETCGIHQPAHIGGGFTHGGNYFFRATVRQIHGKNAHRRFELFLQLLQIFLFQSNRPDFLQTFAVQNAGEFPAHTVGCTGDYCYFHCLPPAKLLF